MKNVKIFLFAIALFFIWNIASVNAALFTVVKNGTGTGVITSGSQAFVGGPYIPNSFINCGSDCSEDISNLPFILGLIKSSPDPTKIIILSPKASNGSFFAAWDYPIGYTTTWINNIEENSEVQQTWYINSSSSTNSQSNPIFNLNSIPQVTCHVENVTLNSATIEGWFNRMGSDVTKSGVIWKDTLPSPPTLSDNIGKTTDGPTAVMAGTWTSNITGLTPKTRYYANVYATNSLGTGYAYATIGNVPCAFTTAPDLKVSINVTPTSTIAGDTTFSATIKNTGSVTTGAGFTNLFQTATSIADLNNPTGLLNYAVPGMSTLAPGATAVTTKTLTLTAGTKYIRVCADKRNINDTNGQIDESNEDNNCSSTWVTVTVTGPTCTDGIKNQDETGIDTGGVCGVPGGPTCTDGIKNQDETGIDTGGICGGGGGATCFDKIKNQDETGIDTGGICGGGGGGTCFDKIKNQDETSIDKGGVCASCVCINGATNLPTCTIYDHDVCPNDPGLQTVLPCANGDYCPNQPGIQTTLPCTVDVCLNDPGLQTILPCANGDYCPNQPGIQTMLPCNAGTHYNER